MYVQTYIVFGSHLTALFIRHLPQMNQVHFIRYKDHGKGLSVRKKTGQKV